MISHYPDFSKLDIKHKNVFTRFVNQYEPYSDFNFVSMFSWDTDGSAEISRLNGNLVIRMPDYLDGHPVYSFLGVHSVDKTIDTLLEAAPKLELVPEIVINHITDASKYRIEEDRDNFDYIYDLRHLSELAGGHYRKKRNKVNVFVRDHEDYELVVEFHKTLSPQQAEELRQVDRAWATATPRDEGDILAERKAIDKLVANFSHFNATATLVRVDGNVKAFSINEIINDDYAICHFEKALSVHHDNIFTFISTEVAKQLLKAGCKWVNWEQDLGLPGLRRSKESYKPVRMLKKYAVRNR